MICGGVKSGRTRERMLWRLLLMFLLVTVAALGAGAAALVADSGILNQTQAQDPVGDSGGADLSSLTVTTYSDGTVSFSVGFANRGLLHLNETAQIFVDLDDDGHADLNLSIWPTGDPSYLAHWTGSGWANVRQLPELVQTNGSFSVRLSLADLRGAAAVPVASSIGVSVGTWTTDPSGNPRADPDDLLPGDLSFMQHQIEPPAAPSTTTTTPTTTPAPAAARLAVVCAKHHSLRATVTPASGSRAVTVSFYANGKLRLTDTRAPYVAAIPTKGLHSPITITATIHASGKTHTLRERAPSC